MCSRDDMVIQKSSVKSFKNKLGVKSTRDLYKRISP